MQDGVKDKLRFTTFYLYFGLTVAELILSCFNEKPPLFSSVVTDPVSVGVQGEVAGGGFFTINLVSEFNTYSSDAEVSILFSFPFQNPCPESSAGFVSRMTFWWFTRQKPCLFLAIGLHQCVEMDEVLFLSQRLYFCFLLDIVLDTVYRQSDQKTLMNKVITIIIVKVDCQVLLSIATAAQIEK